MVYFHYLLMFIYFMIIVTLSPNSVKIHSEETSFYSDPSVILPIIATLLTLLSAGAVAITICFRKSE